MLRDRFEEALNIRGDSHEFVVSCLRLLEIGFRERVLLALGDWDRCELNSALPELPGDYFQAVGSMQRPSWGVWNGIRISLQKTQRIVASSTLESIREQSERATILNEVLKQFQSPIGDEVAERCRPFNPLLNSKLTGKMTLGALLELPISLRNRIAHDSPSEAEWWLNAEAALRPLVEHMAHGVSEPTIDSTTAHSPWIVFEEDDVWTFNGVEKNFSPVYVSRGGRTRFVPGRTQDVLLGFQRLLGVKDRQDRDLKQLLTRLTPDELRGVLMGDLLIGRPIGSGAFATVHYGRQLASGRRVAVKILKSGLDDEDRARFQKEAEYLARLDHPHIVKVFMHGNQSWLPPKTSAVADEPWYQEFVNGDKIKSYMVLEWIDGETLEEIYQRPPADHPSNAQLIEWFAQTAEGLAAVHQSGLIHRDIKPQNILVSAENQIKLLDFGIARHDSRRRTIQTEAGQLLGTPEYMSPEQLRVDKAQEQVGTLSDVYSLCATYFELFSGVRLFRHDTIARETLVTLKLTGAKPERLRQLGARLPLEVETLIEGGLEAEPSLRPASAQLLAEDLRRVQAHLPIRYRPAPLLHRLKLYARRNKRTVQIIGLFTGLLCITVAGAIEIWRYQNAQTRAAMKARDDERVRANTKTQEADESNRKKVIEEYINDIQDAPSLFKDAKIDLLGRRLDKYRDLKGLADPRGFEWYFWSQANRADQQNIDTQGEMCVRVVPAPNGESVAVVARSGVVTVWDVNTGKLLAELPRTAEVVAIDPGSKRILILHGGDKNNEGLWLYDITSPDAGKHLRRASFISSAAFSPNGQTIVYGTAGGDLYAIDADTGKEKICLTNNRTSRRLEVDPRVILDKQNSAILDLAFHPNGRLVASAAEDGTVHLWQVNTGRLMQQIDVGQGPISSISFHPEGTYIASLGLGKRDELRSTENPGALVVHRLADNEVVLKIKPQSEFMRIRGSTTLMDSTGTNGDFRVSFSHDGKKLIGASDRSIKSWRFPTGTMDSEWIGHQGRVLSTGLLNDDRIVSVGEDATLRIWKTQNQLAGRAVVQSDFGIRGLGITSDGTTLAAVVEPGALIEDDVAKRVSFMRLDICEYDSVSGKEQAKIELERELTWLNRIQFSRDNQRAAAELVWDRNTKSILLPHFPNRTAARAISPDGRFVAMCTDNQAILWDLNENMQTSAIDGDLDSETQPAFSPDGEQIALALKDGGIAIHSLKFAREPKLLIGHKKRARTLEFSPNGKWLASGGNDRAVRLWNLSNTEQLDLLGHNREITSVSFSPDGKRLLSTSGDPLVESSVAGELKVWDTYTGRECLTLDGGGGQLFCAAVFDPRQHRIYAACTALPKEFRESSPGAILVWDASKAQSVP